MTAAARVAPGVVLGLLLFATAMTYRGVATYGFLLDDVHAVASNPAIESLSQAPDWFTSAYATSAFREYRGYRPILVASYALDRALWGGGAAGHHRTNLAIHLAVVGLAYVLARRLWSSRVAALVAAMVTALHPINAEAVSYISARSSSLTAFFVLAAVWGYDTGVRAGPRGWSAAAGYSLALTGAFLAAGTKESGAVLPLLILAWDRARFADTTPWRVSLQRCLPFVGATAAVLVVRSMVVGHALAGSGQPSVQSALFGIKIILSSFGHWLLPVGLAADHGWRWTIGPAEAAGLVVGLAAAMGVTAVAYRRSARIGWCVLWSWGALLPLVAIPMVSRVTLYQDHRVYLAGIGLAWALAGLVAIGLRVWSGPTPRAVAAVVGAVLVVAMVRADLARSAVWADESRLWEDVLAKYPDSVVALNARGLLSLSEGRLDDAERDFLATLQLVPGSSEGHKNLGIVYAQAGNLARAVQELHKALAISPGSRAILVELGLAYERAGEWEAAGRAYAQIVETDPDEMLALKGLARVADGEQRYAEAARRYREALAADPGDDQARMSLGAVLVRLEQWDEAREAFEAVLSRYPGHAPARFNLGVALDGLGDAEAATRAYGEAAARLPRDAEIAFRVGLMHARYGRLPEAAAAYQTALLRDPQHVLSRFNLARIAEQLGDRDLAIRQYRTVAGGEASQPGTTALREQARAALRRLGVGG